MTEKPQLTRPIIGMENRTAQEVFDIMCDRIKHLTRPTTAAPEDVLEAMARFVCEWEDADPDASLGGDGINFRWHEAKNTLVLPLLTMLFKSDAAYATAEEAWTRQVVQTTRFITVWRKAGSLDWDFYVSETADELQQALGNLEKPNHDKGRANAD